jgi:hypothetical protein
MKLKLCSLARFWLGWLITAGILLFVATPAWAWHVASCSINVSADKVNVCIGEPVHITVTPSSCCDNTTRNFTVTYATSGDYTVSDQICGKTWSINIHVSGTPPSITSQPEDQWFVHVGESASFTVTASGTPPLSYQWRKNLSNISGATSQTLTLSNVTINDQALYDVVVANACGSVVSYQPWLRVGPRVFEISCGPGYSACGGCGMIELWGSNTGVDYELVRLSPVFTPLVQLKPGTGGPLQFGPLTEPGVYTVMASWPDPFCTEDCGYGWEPMSGTVTHYGMGSLTATCSRNSIALDWSLSGVFSPSCITGFVIKRSTTQGGPYAVLCPAGPNGRFFVDTTVVPGVTYYYVVTLQSSAGESHSDEAASSTCECSTPKYEPEYWNDGEAGPIQYNNNCYNYANNVRTDTYAQPGRASGTQCTDDSCVYGAYFYQAAVNDGLVPSSKSEVCPDGMTKVALFFHPDEEPGSRDYHWYRQDAPNGYWSQKFADGPATDKDTSQTSPITDPEIAARYTGYDLVGYLCTCSDYFQGQGHANIW